MNGEEGVRCKGGVHDKGDMGAVYMVKGVRGKGACMAGDMRGRRVCVAGKTATAADGTHPTGMHSCCLCFFLQIT